MVTICLSALLEQNTPLNCCAYLVATVGGVYLAGTMAEKLGDKMFDVDKADTRANWQEQA